MGVRRNRTDDRRTLRGALPAAGQAACASAGDLTTATGGAFAMAAAGSRIM